MTMSRLFVRVFRNVVSWPALLCLLNHIYAEINDVVRRLYSRMRQCDTVAANAGGPPDKCVTRNPFQSELIIIEMRSRSGERP